MASSFSCLRALIFWDSSSTLSFSEIERPGKPDAWFFFRNDDLSFSASLMFLMRLRVSELNLKSSFFSYGRISRDAERHLTMCANARRLALRLPVVTLSTWSSILKNADSHVSNRIF